MPTMPPVIDTTSILHAAGLRRTPVRSAVIDLLAKARRPQSVQDLLNVMPAGTDVVTIYRTLNTLVKKRLARRIRNEDRSWLFEIAIIGEPNDHVHAHFVCDSCGRVECLPDVEVPALAPRSAKLNKGYEVTKQDLTLHGTCPKCH
jgi:Fur family transcriptional regulator, ferric uptake regulator